MLYVRDGRSILADNVLIVIMRGKNIMLFFYYTQMLCCFVEMIISFCDHISRQTDFTQRVKNNILSFKAQKK